PQPSPYSAVENGVAIAWRSKSLKDIFCSTEFQPSDYKQCSHDRDNPMRPQELRERLRGVIAFPITPFQTDLSLDVEGLRRNIQLLMQHPIAAIVAVGGTGELYSLTAMEHLTVVNAIVDEVRGRIPIISGTGFNLPMAVQLAQQSERLKADAILALPPY